MKFGLDDGFLRADINLNLHYSEFRGFNNIYILFPPSTNLPHQFYCRSANIYKIDHTKITGEKIKTFSFSLCVSINTEHECNDLKEHFAVVDQIVQMSAGSHLIKPLNHIRMSHVS